MFFGFILSSLVIIFVLFKPLDVKKQEFIDVPIFEITSFNMYELNNKGLQGLMIGNSALRYSDRYEVTNIDYTENTKMNISNMKAKRGLYQGETVSLFGNVNYVRADGLTFESQKMIYDKHTSQLSSTTPFLAYKEGNSIKGDSMKYNKKRKFIESQNVKVTYQLQESKI
nr:LPS export ABC transporter periplasmic protein LptC [Sulfurimonas sp.]